VLKKFCALSAECLSDIVFQVEFKVSTQHRVWSWLKQLTNSHRGLAIFAPVAWWSGGQRLMFWVRNQRTALGSAADRRPSTLRSAADRRPSTLRSAADRRPSILRSALYRRPSTLRSAADRRPSILGSAARDPLLRSRRITEETVFDQKSNTLEVCNWVHNILQMGL
jgi:hypothetical protein